MTASDFATQQKSQASKLAALAAEERAREEQGFWDRAFCAGLQGLIAQTTTRVSANVFVEEATICADLALSARRNRGEGR